MNDGGSPEVNGEFIRYYNGFPGWDRSRIDPVKWKDALSYRKNASFLVAVSAAYDLCVSREDDAVSALLKGLEDLSGRPLLVIVTSDHGTLLGEHGLLGHGRHYFEPLARVPLLMRFPDGRSPRRVPDIAEHADLLPTICAVAGTSCPGGLDGRDLSAAPGGTDRSGWAAAGDIGGSSRTVIRTAAFSENGKKLTLGVRRWRLYDLAADPGETKDIAKERPEEFLRLASGYLAVSGAGKLIRAAMPEGKGEDCFWRGTGAPIQPAWSRQDYKFSARPGLWKMTKGGFSAVYSEGGGLVCENEKGLVVTDPECLAPAMAMLNCVEHHRFGDKETDEARGRNIRDALKKAGYVP